MHIKLLTLRFSPDLGKFDEAPLEAFTRDRELLGFREHFFCVNDIPHLACVITCRNASGDAGSKAGSQPAADGPHGRRKDATVDLAGDERRLFDTLRTWRAEVAEREGVPRYVVFTNRELVEIVRRRPQSSQALCGIPGIARARVERHGKALLATLKAQDPTSAALQGDGEAS